jgi:uncharacterized repeat protein (TIGR02543 family)
MIKKIIVLGLLTSMLFLGFFFVPSSPSDIIEVLYEVQSIEQAQEISKQYELPLIDHSDFGFAIFHATASQMPALLEMGFSQNHQSTRLAPPWTKPLSDPYYNEQYAIGMLDLTNAWLLSEGSSSVMIAIIDSGIDTDHEEFVNRISPLSYNSRTKQVGISYIEDDNGHGTAVAGVIGAIKGNQKGIAGVIQNASLLVIKANNIDNLSTVADESDTFSDSSIIEGIRYATSLGADVINLSLGGKSSNSLVQNAITDARNAGVIVVAASGNFNETNPDTGIPVKVYPASYQGVISVGSVNSNAVLSAFSMYNDMLDVVAPGEGIVTTGLNNGYITASGTSFSAPMVSGVIGLMISHLSSFTDEDIVNQLITTSNDLGQQGYDIYYGHGLVDAYQAMLVDYVAVTFETSGGTQIPVMNVAKNMSFTVENPTKTGYTFAGWYRDQTFTSIFQMGIDTVSEASTLWAKFIPNSYSVTYVTSGTPLANVSVFYDQYFTPESSSLVGHDFIGWYLEDNYQTLYSGGIITGNLTLYAKFIPKSFIITFMANGEIDAQVTLNYHELPTLYIPESTYPFIGWYTDTSLTQAYQISMIESDLILYARFDDGLYHVTFYDSDLTSVYQLISVFYGASVPLPDGPIKPSSPSFDFNFSGWSSTVDHVTMDQEIYPLYTMVYRRESIQLLPGVDTVLQGMEHIDAGVSLSDSLLHIEITSDLDTDQTGRYMIRYDIIHDQVIIDTRYRVIHVIMLTPTLSISFNPDITTLKQGDTYHDAGAIVSIGTLSVSGEVNTMIPGIYVLTYTLTYQSVVIQKSKVIHILSETEYYQRPILFIEDKKGVWFR